MFQKMYTFKEIPKFMTKILFSKFKKFQSLLNGKNNGLKQNNPF